MVSDEPPSGLRASPKQEPVDGEHGDAKRKQVKGELNPLQRPTPGEPPFRHRCGNGVGRDVGR